MKKKVVVLTYGWGLCEWCSFIVLTKTVFPKLSLNFNISWFEATLERACYLTYVKTYVLRAVSVKAFFYD